MTLITDVSTQEDLSALESLTVTKKVPLMRDWVEAGLHRGVNIFMKIYIMPVIETGDKAMRLLLKNSRSRRYRCQTYFRIVPRFF